MVWWSSAITTILKILKIIVNKSTKEQPVVEISTSASVSVVQLSVWGGFAFLGVQKSIDGEEKIVFTHGQNRV